MGRASLWLKTPQPGKSAAASTVAAIAFLPLPFLFHGLFWKRAIGKLLSN